MQRVLLHPRLRLRIVRFAVALILVRDHGVLGIVWLRGAQQRLQADQRSANGERRRPLILEDVEADGASLRRNIWVPNPGLKLHLQSTDVLFKLSAYLWGLEGIVWGNLDVHVEGASLVRCVFL